MGLGFKDNTSLSRVYNGETKAETCTFPYPGFLRDGENIDEPVYSKTFKSQEEKNNADMRFRRKVDGSHFNFNSSPSTFCTEPSDVHLEKITVTETFIYEKHCDIEVDVNDINMSKSHVQGDTPIAILFRLAINDPRMNLVSGLLNLINELRTGNKVD